MHKGNAVLNNPTAEMGFFDNPGTISGKTYGVPFRERICFGLGDAAQNVFMAVSMMFISIFYTDVFKLSPAFVGTLFLATRVIDAITDPLVGSLTDRYVGKLGRYRTWMKWAALPYCLSLVFVFWAPDLMSESARQAYAAMTYIFLILSNTCFGVPYVSLNGVITSDPKERLEINGIRFPLAKSAGFVCSLAIPLLMAYFSSQEVAYRVAMSSIAILTFILSMCCVYGTRERVTEMEAEKGDIRSELNTWQQIKAFWENEQARIICVYLAILLMAATLRSGGTAYYVFYYLGESEFWLSAMLMSGAVAGMLGPVFAVVGTRRGWWNATHILIISQALAGLVMLAGYGITRDGILLAIVLNCIITFIFEMQCVVVWSATGNCADYGKIKYGKNIRGVLNGALMFSLKLGMAIGGALLGYILSFYGYSGGEQVTAEQLSAFTMLIFGAPAVISFLNGWLVATKFKLTPEYMLDFMARHNTHNSEA